ncbi:PREDICTED: uncharacterized serine-rich protein C215.13-like isoform X1 [Erythranthe guttata]|nr:PREDICTED: uncharacterized serine-rich protein C215.13-like isoform X1 [Erythranthe guttata]|eukprot:XP_012850335.1 PREDICTED: uncharacterized serine-rich protein C215.13-like isoform X1 [Erythranthe guttata]
MSVQLRPQNRDLGMVMREVDEDLAIFLGMRTNADNQMIDHFLVDASLDFHVSKGSENESQAEALPSMADENLLNLDIETSDYSWLLPQPNSSSLPSVETDEQDSASSQIKISESAAISSKSELENTRDEESSASLNDTSSTSAIKKPLSSKDKKPSLPAKSKPAPRTSTPTSRPTLSSSTTRPISRSSTPSSRPSIPIISKSGPRSSTPTARKPTCAPALDRSSSGKKMGPTITKSSVQSRGTSPTVKSRPSKPSENILSSSQNPKVSSVPKRPVSASRSTRSSSSSNEKPKPRQKSCSPPKVRASVIRSGYKTGSKILSRSSNGVDDDVNPVLMGTKMVDRVVNMRKLAPPKQDEYAVSSDNTRKSSHENSGFGRSLSKKSLDMAIRHMDIRRSIPEKLRPIATRSGCAKSSTTTTVGDLSESPLSSNCDSSKSSM